jgi:GT2 family glycosyltransferase
MCQDYSEFDIWVLDNASTDGSVEMVNNEFPGVLVISNEKNLGFTGAGNVGIFRASKMGYAYILLLANDVVLDSRCISGAVAAFQANPGAGMIGFFMIGAFFYTPFEEFEKAVASWSGLELEETKYVEGAAYLAAPSVIERLGGYDEMLFMYGDENDLETRLTRAGYSLLKTNIPVWHNSGCNVMGEFKLKSGYYVFRNTLILMTKHETLRYTLRATLSLVRTACDPFRRVSRNNMAALRSRPSNIFVNFIVICIAVLSYGVNLRKILRTRQKHIELIDCERACTKILNHQRN